MMKHDKETVKDRHIFSHQECGCKICYSKARDVLIAELESLCIIDVQRKPNIMRLSEKFADALPSSDNDDIPHITNQDIWGTLVMRFNQTEPDAIQDYGIIIRMVIDALIDTHRNNTTNKHGGDMYGV
jgi:hypothetical protein